MPENTRREQELFLQALELPDGPGRSQLLDHACAGDPDLRARLELLLRNAAQAEIFFDDARAPASLRASLDQPPPMVDRYRLLRRLGQGSCGVVYLAEQLEPVRREVALKIIRLGLDTRRIMARFALERQTLARMDHPNIARVYDAGATPGGLPFFVMEYVRGEPLATYCDRQSLDLDARLDLFVQICAAVAHAHCRGIVHRDIKPANILVTSAPHAPPAPKLIDFGIAKAIDDHRSLSPDATQAAQIIGTPAYMSPEQVAGDGRPIDTRSDIYSLGALLCELLVGQPPFTQAQLTRHGLPGLVKTILEVEPPRPSDLLAALPPDARTRLAALRSTPPAALARRLRHDLDWIVLKALEKSPDRRYENARALADDILRSGRNQPVSARPPSRAYRLRKLVRRHRVAVVAGTLVALALLLGTTTSTWLFFRERRALQTQVLLREQAENARAAEALLRRQAESVNAFAAAAVELSHGNLTEAEALIASTPPEFVPPSLENIRVLRELGLHRALAGDWTPAAGHFLAMTHAITRTDDADSDSVSRDLIFISAALLQAGKTTDYETFRRLTLDRFAATAHPVVAEQMLKCCLLLPAPPEMRERLRAPAAIAEASLHPDDPLADAEPYLAAWRCITLALYHYRTNTDPAVAAAWAERSMRYPEGNHSLSATAYNLLAMIHHTAGDDAAAQAALAKAQALLPTHWTYPLPRGDPQTGSWAGWVHARLLFQEAAATLAPATNSAAKDAITAASSTRSG